MKRSKAYYRKCSGRKKFKRETRLDVGMKGLLITCNNNEKRCIREAYNILMEYADRLYGSEGQNKDAEASSSDEDIEESLRKEVETMQNNRNKKKFRFQSVDSRAKNVVFIKTNIPDDPVKLVHHMLKDIEVKGQSVSQHILRIHPVSITCRANLQQIEKASLEILSPYFHGPNVADAMYAIVFKCRNNKEIVKNEVMSVIGTAIKSDKSHDHKVNLEEPDYTIIVEVICNVCCLSVVRDYNKLKRYNLYELGRSGERAENKGECVKNELNKEANQFPHANRLLEHNKGQTQVTTAQIRKSPPDSYIVRKESSDEILNKIGDDTDCKIEINKSALSGDVKNREAVTSNLDKMEVEVGDQSKGRQDTGEATDTFNTVLDKSCLSVEENGTNKNCKGQEESVLVVPEEDEDKNDFTEWDVTQGEGTSSFGPKDQNISEEFNEKIEDDLAQTESQRNNSASEKSVEIHFTHDGQYMKDGEGLVKTAVGDSKDMKVLNDDSCNTSEESGFRLFSV